MRTFVRVVGVIALMLSTCAMPVSPQEKQGQEKTAGKSEEKASNQEKQEQEKEKKECKDCKECKLGEKVGCIAGAVDYAGVKKYPAVVYIDEMSGKTFTPPKEHVLIDQKNKEFIPRILTMLVGTTVDFLNSDNIAHNVFSPDGEKYDLGNYNQGEKREYTFKHTGAYTQLCSLHPEMIGYAIVCGTPYYALTDADGKFTLKNVPVGKWKLKVWHERLKPKQLDKTYDVTVEEGKEASITLTP